MREQQKLRVRLEASPAWAMAMGAIILLRAGSYLRGNTVTRCERVLFEIKDCCIQWCLDQSAEGENILRLDEISWC
jgi:hypothetical protein